MSDFDKEAERERLREKYERDQAKREATERMSELLLKGATMTNAHCENCGDPIFRYEGQEFCPTCQQVVESDVDEGGADTVDQDAATEASAGSEEVDADDGGEEAEARSPRSIEMKRPTGPTAQEADANGDASGTRAEAGNQGAPAGSEPTGESRQAPQQPPTRPAGSSTGSPAGAPAAGGAGEDLADARAALTQALTFHARQAAGTSDPRRAKDHLAAAREAAEALSALY